VEQTLPLIVKNDGRRQPYDRDKLLAGLRRACVKRPVSADSLERVLLQVERWLVDTGEAEVSSARLGEHVLHELKELDPVAYVRFASVYKDFQDVDEFFEELAKLRG
jgi:transcriptional repressor NrdR